MQLTGDIVHNSLRDRNDTNRPVEQKSAGMTHQIGLVANTALAGSVQLQLKLHPQLQLQPRQLHLQLYLYLWLLRRNSISGGMNFSLALAMPAPSVEA